MARKVNMAINYKGGKGNLVDWIVGHFPTDFTTYVEPFGGGFSVGLNIKAVPTMVYNDTCGEIVNFFSVLRKRGDELVRELELTPYSREEFEESMIMVDDELEQARRTAVRAMMSFNGKGFRAVNNNNTSAPKRFSKYVEGLGGVIETFRGVTIENRDATELISAHDGAKTLFYFDPPYVGFEDDYFEKFNDDRHVFLANQIKNIKGYAVVSGYDSPVMDELYPVTHFRKYVKSVNVGSFKKKSTRVEVLFVSNNVPVGLFDDVGGGGK